MFTVAKILEMLPNEGGVELKTLEKMLNELDLPPPYAHREKPDWTRQDAELLLQAVREKLDQLAPLLADNS